MKKRTAARAGAATATYSTRFDTRQRKLIDEAAVLANCSPAKLIREAAVMRAADVVNGRGEAAEYLRDLAGQLVEQLKYPKLAATVGNPRGESEARQVKFGEPVIDEEEQGLFRLENAKAVRPSDRVLGELKAALETSGTEFIRMVVEQWDVAGTDKAGYKPKVSAAEFLKGQEDKAGKQ